MIARHAKYWLSDNQNDRKEKDFYLHHDFTGAVSAEGALFKDLENNRWPQDDNTVIYGHNMKNGHIFGALDLILSTCEYSQENGRLVIVARKV